VILLTTSLVLAVGMVLTLTYLLGFRLGGDSWLGELQRVRAEAAAAQRQLHELTRSAIVAMAEEAEKRRRNER
jgi:hypothetical protein